MDLRQCGEDKLKSGAIVDIVSGYFSAAYGIVGFGRKTVLDIKTAY